MTSQHQPSLHNAAIADALSSARVAPYLAAAGGNVRSALRLYRWNIELSAAAYQALHLFEVMLRNALDRQLRAWNATQRVPTAPDAPGRGRLHGPEWLVDPSHLLVRLVQQGGPDEARKQVPAAAVGHTSDGVMLTLTAATSLPQPTARARPLKED